MAVRIAREPKENRVPAESRSAAMSVYKEITNCRICGNSNLESLIDLGVQSLTGVFPKSRSESVAVGPLELVKCVESPQTCGLVQLRHSFSAESMYGQSYGYRSGLNKSMVDHLRGLVSHVRAFASLNPGDLVLDIGSNDGTLLSCYEAPELLRVGMDPTAIKFRQFYPAGVHVIPDFFSRGRFLEQFGSKKAKIVTSVAMFYDLESPIDFMIQVRDILAEDGVWAFEQSYLPTMLETNSYDTICHEHLEYYGFRQIEFMARIAGLKIISASTNAANGGSFRIIAARDSSLLKEDSNAISQLKLYEASCHLEAAATYESFRKRVHDHRDQLRAFLGELARRGERVMGYGASTKGNVLLQFCDISSKELPCIAEVNPDKFGLFTPGTSIPIVSEEEARQMQPDALLVLPWHFRPFIIQREHAFLSAGGRLIFPLPRLETVSHA